MRIEKEIIQLIDRHKTALHKNYRIDKKKTYNFIIIQPSTLDAQSSN